MSESTQSPTTERSPLVPSTMRSAFHERYGPPEKVVSVRTVPTPTPGVGEVLVRVRAASVNALDWHYVTGLPMFARPSLGLRRPKRQVPGADASGEVVAIGERVTRHRIGDQVFGELDGGGFAEYAMAPEDWWQPLPEGVSHEQATTLGVAAETALQGLRDWGNLREGQRVLIAGASGGVGSFAVRLAKLLGATHVTAVCSTRNVEHAQAGGADRVVDYTRQDVRDLGDRFDVFFDNAGTMPLRDCRTLLVKGGTYVSITAPKSTWVKPMPRMLAVPVFFALTGEKAPAFKVASRSVTDQGWLVEQVATGRLEPLIEQRWSLEDAPEVLRRQGEFHARGKSLVIP
ncbi:MULTISPECIES: NAD(P)-dependent alcohol dehydrogenase [unclassified Knoellia]|uniref:NAD(P)-dependent alcohol dehydrogenase n=1 Tax=Knoellia altitudinis TaxID=3404795 RepID=UPI00362331E4